MRTFNSYALGILVLYGASALPQAVCAQSLQAHFEHDIATRGFFEEEKPEEQIEEKKSPVMLETPSASGDRWTISEDSVSREHPIQDNWVINSEQQKLEHVGSSEEGAEWRKSERIAVTENISQTIQILQNAEALADSFRKTTK